MYVENTKIKREARIESSLFIDNNKYYFLTNFTVLVWVPLLILIK